MHRHDFYECFLVLEGNGQQHTPFGSEDLQPHVLYFVRPEHSHAIDGHNNLVFLNIAFEKSTFEATFDLANFKHKHWLRGTAIQVESLNQQQVNEFKQLASNVANQRERSDAAWLLLSISRLLNSRHTYSDKQPDMPDWMAKGLSKAIDSEVLTEGLPLLNQLMGRSREHVARSFQNHLGMTPTEWLTKERIQRACLLLSTTRLPLIEIALDCGFESSSYFHKCFRQYMHTTPRRYRSNLMRIQN